MKAIAIENFGFVAGGADADVKMISEGASVFCPEGVNGIASCAAVTITGPSALGSPLSLGDSAALGSLAGGGLGIAAYLGGAAGAVGLGETLAVATMLGGVVGVASLGVAVAVIYGYKALDQYYSQP